MIWMGTEKAVKTDPQTLICSCAIIKCEYFKNQRCVDRNPIYYNGPCRKSHFWQTPEGILENWRRERELEKVKRK